VVGISLCVRFGAYSRVIHSNTTFGLSDRLEVRLHHVRMSAGNGTVKTKGRSLDAMRAIKKRIVTVKAAVNCLAYALIIAIGCVNNDTK